MSDTKNPFGNLKSEGLEETTDRLGGGFQARDTGAGDFTIKAFYAGSSDGGAQNVSIIAVDAKGVEYRETIYITNKKGENWFLNKDDNTKKVPLPGFTTINDICLLTTEKPLCDQEWEEKTIKIYDFESKKDMPTAVLMAVDVVGQPVTLGLLKVLENKKKKDGAGGYETTAEEITKNTIAKVFHTESKLTWVEAENGSEAEFYDKWVEKYNATFVQDKREIKDGQGGKPVSKTPPQAGGAGGTAAPKKSLFGAGKK